MRVSVETTSGLERRLTVGVPADQIDTAVDKRLQEAARNVRLPGFRPGKVPMRVMKQRFGAGVRQEVLGEVISRSFQEAVMSENLRPAGQPSIEARKMDAGQDVEYTATFEVFPAVEVNSLEDLAIEKPMAEVSDADIDDIVEVFRKQQGQLVSAERAAIEGDTVIIDFEGLRDGEVFEGGSGEGTSLELGSGRMIPGFEDGLIGASAGEEKRLKLTFPEDYQKEDLAGADVEFKVSVSEVQELELAAVDAALFAQYGLEEGTEDDFRAEVKQNMERELRNAVEASVKTQVMDAILAAHQELELPASLIAQEVNAMRQQMFQQFGGAAPQEMDLASILPDEMFAEQAERRVKLGLVMAEMISQSELTAEPAKVREAIEDIASTYQDPEEVINWYYSENEQLAGIESRVLEDAVVDKLLSEAAIAEIECSYQDALAKARPDAPA
ncbi:MAG: trigger factor [Halieaceae bacterium]|nr:MAG: trigger factor [Halieaceae bacterium]|tara:strand:- start:1222 stop:2550 length:1329 start_codon:yes stop_codon:yes gene_type:complete